MSAEQRKQARIRSSLRSARLLGDPVGRVWPIEGVGRMNTAKRHALSKVVNLLLDVAHAAHHALEDSEESNRGTTVTPADAAALQAALSALDDLPAEPGFVSVGPHNAAYALRKLR